MQKVLAQVVLIGLLAGCSAAGNSRSALTFVPGDDFKEAFRVASARLEKATGLLAIEDTQGRPIYWGKVPVDPERGQSRCAAQQRERNGIRVNEGIVCDENSPWMMDDPAVGELIILHELGHAFNPGSAYWSNDSHPSDGNVMAASPKIGACLTDVDLNYICEMGACSKFEPECWID